MFCFKFYDSFNLLALGLGLLFCNLCSVPFVHFWCWWKLNSCEDIPLFHNKDWRMRYIIIFYNIKLLKLFTFSSFSNRHKWSINLYLRRSVELKKTPNNLCCKATTALKWEKLFSLVQSKLALKTKVLNFMHQH